MYFVVCGRITEENDFFAYCAWRHLSAAVRLAGQKDIGYPIFFIAWVSELSLFQSREHIHSWLAAVGNAIFFLIFFFYRHWLVVMFLKLPVASVLSFHTCACFL